MILRYLKILLTICCLILPEFSLSDINYQTNNLSDSLQKSDFKEKIKYSATDSIIYDLKNSMIHLYNNSKINYNSIKINAYYISIDFNQNTVFAKGKIDSTGQLIQKPIFFESEKKYISETMKYNFETKKGVTTKLLTQEGDSYLHGEKMKKENNTIHYLSKGLYTTCELATPHFFIKANKIKFIQGEKIISGPAHLIIEDIPTPLLIPFAIFPINNKRNSGILLPSYGNSIALGYNLKNLGY